jgi:predicted amidohydrolase
VSAGLPGTLSSFVVLYLDCRQDLNMYDLVITNGICVTASDVAPLDIAIQGEKIALLAPSGSLAKQGTRVIDAEGGFIMVSWSL